MKLAYILGLLFAAGCGSSGTQFGNQSDVDTPPTATCQEAFMDPIHNAPLMDSVSESKYNNLVMCFCDTIGNGQCGTVYVEGEPVLVSEEQVNNTIAANAAQPGSTINQKWFSQCAVLENACMSDRGE